MPRKGTAMQLAYLLRWIGLVPRIVVRARGARNRWTTIRCLAHTIAEHLGWHTTPRTYRVELDGSVFHLNSARRDLAPFASIWIRREYEPDARFIPPERGVVVDVGAHVGFFAVRAARSVAGGRVYAIEPDPGSFSRLEANVRANRVDVKLRNCAMGGRQGTARFESAPFSVDSRIRPDGGVEVACTTLDRLSREEGLERIDLLKLDAETAELEILRGAREVALPLVRAAAVEIHAEASIEPIDRIMQEAGLAKVHRRDIVHFYVRDGNA